MRDIAMGNPPDAEAPKLARVAGLAYLITIASGLFAEVYVRASIRSADPASTGERFHDLEQLHRLGVLADCLMLVSYVVVTATLYRLFKPVSATVSLLAALFSLVGIAILAASMTILLVPIYLDGPSTAFEALRLHGAAFNLSSMFFGPYCALIGWLVVRSGWLPAWIGWLMVLAGITFVLHASIGLVAPALAKSIPEAVMLISLLAEGSLALWLAVFGVRSGSSAADRESRGT